METENSNKHKNKYFTVFISFTNFNNLRYDHILFRNLDFKYLVTNTFNKCHYKLYILS
jgi:hypothetical protein